MVDRKEQDGEGSSVKTSGMTMRKGEEMGVEVSDRKGAQ